MERRRFVLGAEGVPGPHGIGITLRLEWSVREDYAYLAGQPGFDAEYYRATVPEVGSLDMDPLLHFLRYGVFMGDKPNPTFATQWYWREYRHYIRYRENPLVYDLRRGRSDGLLTMPLTKASPAASRSRA